tara:strand:+ start:193365 stop:194294 length:930 start_codon:yes stop_codon:yes gene_type:complete
VSVGASAAQGKVQINEVGPRDGLQNQARILQPEQRLRLIEALVGAGLSAIEVGAFVSPKSVPCMAATDQVIAGLPAAAVNYSALIPNRKGYDMARASGIETVNLVVAASNTMNEKNIRMSTSEVMAISAEVIQQARSDQLCSQVYIATAWACPFEGAVPESVVIELAGQLLAQGVATIIIADTIGAADPAVVRSLMQELVKEYGTGQLSCHFHDTRGMGVANVYAAVEVGVRSFDASIGGLGGCPFAPGATGNVATEDVVLLLEQMGFITGINMKKLLQAVDLAAELTGSCQGGHASKWLRGQAEKGLL